MISRGLSSLAIALAAPLLAAALMAQSAPVLQVSVAAGGTSTNVSAGGSLALAATDFGQPVLATVTVKYTGAATAVITSVNLAGTSEMTLLAPPPTPVTLNPNTTTSFTVQYVSTTGNAVSSQVSLAYTENNQASAFLFGLTGTSPHLTYSYYFAPTGALTDLNAGDRISFPSTNLGAATQAVFTVLNRGTAAGALQGVSSSSSIFQLSGSSAPVTLQPGQQTSFSVGFSPQAVGVSQGLLTLTLPNSNITFSLAGTGGSTTISISYSLADGNVHPITSGAVINLPSVDINGSSSATVTVLNQGTGSGTVTSVSVGGLGFQLTGVPLLPATLAPGQSLRFTIVFSPTQTGSFLGTFGIVATGATVTGTLTASTNAPNFTASYAIGNSAAAPLTSGAVLSFPSVDVNGSATATVTIQNQGAGAGTVTSVGVSSGVFQLTGLPALPATVPVGQSLKFNIVFAPTQTGLYSATFTIFLGGTAINGSLTGSTTSSNFSLSYTLADSIVHSLSSGSTISFPSIDINATTNATITIANQGSGSGTVSNIAVSGAGFQLTSVPALPATVAAGQSLRFGIVFNPTQAGTIGGTFRIDMTGSSVSGTLSGATAASNITLAYIDPDTNNVLALPNNATLTFPNTLSGSVSNITIVAANSGAGTGAINAVALSGGSASSFQITNLPALPLSVPPSQQVRFGVRFAPQQSQPFSTTLQVSINGQSTTINLAGQGTGAQYTYASSSGSGTAPVAAGGTLAIADTSVGESTAVTLTVTNNGTADGQISAVNVSGQGLSLSGLPAGTITLHPNASQQFTLTFAPQQPGVVKGQLTIGSDTFTITATGIGSKLTFLYTNTAAATPVTEGGVILFTPGAVGSSQNLTLSVQNTGTSAANISSINLVAASSVFSLQKLPNLPMNLSPGATVTFTASFLPNNTGTLTATLAINTSTFTLSGTGTQPSALPSYQFQGPGNPQPAQQTGIGLTLASPYPLPLRGTLTLTFVSSVFTDDPSIQFANGGRSIDFTIPANSTQALFNGTATAVPLQTGTTAGTLTLTPSFAMQNGFDMTPASPGILNLALQSVAPQLLGSSVTAETLSSFTVNVSGFSNSHTLRQLDIQITPKSGANFSSSHLTIDVNSASSAWFQSVASHPFGGTFQVSIPFTLQNGSNTADLVHMIQSLSITATNEAGTSSAVSVTIP